MNMPDFFPVMFAERIVILLSCPEGRLSSLTFLCWGNPRSVILVKKN